MDQQPQAIVCNVCGGDPRTSRNCPNCKGAGVGIASNEGFLVWGRRIDDFSIKVRKFRVQVNSIFHYAILLLTVLCLGVFLWNAIGHYGYQDVSTLAFWTSGLWFVNFFYAAVLLAAFFVFRMNEFTETTKTLPGWMPSRNSQPSDDTSHKSQVTRVALDVSDYYSPQALEIVENAFKIAKDLGRVEISPEIIYASVLASHSGSLFMARLGMSFDKIKEPLVKLMMMSSAGAPPIEFSKESKRALALAYERADGTHRKYVSAMEVFLQVFLESQKLQDMLDRLGYPPGHITKVAEWILMQDQMREDQERFAQLAKFKPKNVMNRAMTAQQTSLLDRFSEDLTMLALHGYVPPMVGNKKIMDDLLRAIESGNRAVVLVGETGSGKAAVVEQLARMMVEESVPEVMFDKRLVSVDLAQVVAAGEAGQAAERLISMLREVQSSGNIVLALYGIEALVGGGRGPMDLAETFASEIDKNNFIIVATTTPGAWTQYLERRSLGKKLTKVVVPDADLEQTIRVLMARSGAIEYQNKVFFSYAALDKAANLALRYLHDLAAPANAIGVIKEAAVMAKNQRGEMTFVSAEDVAKIVHDKTNIPVEMVSKEESQKLLTLEDRMHGRIIGQDEAVVAVARSIRRARAELREGKRPIANFLFLGPTGVGKTECAKTLAQEYFSDENAMVRVDMSEYQDKSSVDRIIGAPGDDRGGLLTEAVRNKPFTIVLLDEIEKAHPDILNLFLQVMDDGRLTDGTGRVIDFTNTIIIMTSNAGTSYIQHAVSEGTSMEVIKTGLLERELKGIFRPEFLNRFDAVIVFKPLTRDQVVQIAWLMINKIGKQLEAKGISFRADDKAVEQLADAGFDPQFGARPLRRVMQDRVETQLADIILKNEVERKDTIVLQPDGSLKVEKAPAL